ncbi:Pyrimidine-specific ribonucleoside hydrolase RihB (plasmid) [Aquisphaera giovannonii]|uniref:Pyrimidine-specific ribonucleoside hydrolase RihB n=1 Tax=Aquisphaera giovannonii TaxID=406548 RepID=A0A5B9WGY8_9BACT|nr:nucleoside hydrolase [Aquisphaera giovannonii]QEH39255.1 Pyrimidine-specific ribonucleoside hydrolase RihB [Aquisphaera giovannonii]
MRASTPFACIVILLMPLAAVAAGPRQKVIFDCDLGGDIDDAFALSLLLSSPEFEVLGLVMDHGNTTRRGQVAARLLYEMGLEKQIPVVIGRATPAVVGEDTEIAGDSKQFLWGRGFESWKPASADAAGFLIENIRKYPGEVILFTVGPVCNIQDVLRRDPGALKQAKRVIAMFGSFTMGYGGPGTRPDAEWNVRADARAGQALLASGARLTLAGLDTTTMVKLREADRTRLLYRNSPLTDALCGLYILWRQEGAGPDPTLFDVVPVGMVLWPDLFTTRPAHVRVTEKGFTELVEGAPPNCEIGVTVQADELVKRTMNRYLEQNLMRPHVP